MSCKTMQMLTGIEERWFQDFIEEKKDIHPLSKETTLFITHLMTQLTLGMDIDIDSRLHGIIEMFPTVYNMDFSTLSSCVNIDEHIISDFMKGVSLSSDQKYELAVKVMFLYYMFKFPDYAKCAGENTVEK